MPVTALFFDPQFMPHGHCYFWRPSILWTHVTADFVIGLSYFSIPLALLTFIRKRSDIKFDWLFYMFAAFIFLCGSTHFFSIWTVWNPDYAVEGLLKAATASVSLITAIALWRLIPGALRIPSHQRLEEEVTQRTGELQKINLELRDEIKRRRSMEDLLADKNLELETVNQALASSNHDLESFTYIVSHDLQEPLRMITAFSELLQKKLDPEIEDDSKQYLHYLTGAAQQMHGLIDSFLSLASAGSVELEKQNINTTECVEKALAALQLRIDEQSAKIEHPMLPPIYADASLVIQLYQNLIGNALKFAHPDRAPVIRLTAQAEKNVQIVVLGVADNGIGIEEAYHEKIFEPFKRLHSREKYSGTGIGLSTCRKIVERLGGKLWVESTPDIGSHFKFSLPLAQE